MRRTAQVVNRKPLPRVSQPGQLRRAPLLRPANDNAAPLRRRLRPVGAVGSLLLLLALLLMAI